MTEQKIIEWAREAGAEIRNGHAYQPYSLDQFLKRYTALVAAHERDAVVDIACGYSSRLKYDEDFIADIEARSILTLKD